MTPTSELYSSLQKSFDFFNETLFDRGLPTVIFTVQRQKSVMGYFAPDRWASKEGKNCHEIAINPSYVGQAAIIELFQTLVHEMVHCWQHVHGTPGRRGYHNKEWAKKMKDVGLMPSTTGRPGGKETGERMSDYPIAGGLFIDKCKTLVSSESFILPWVDRYARVTPPNEVFENYSEVLGDTDSVTVSSLTSTVSELLQSETLVIDTAAQKVKSKYTCQGCKANVWGRSGLNISCDDCDLSMEEN
ncbi:SprT-like domain-containing protein [Agarilytica rhodophyticola]|uniref:SprT-like domain-containing protein n=1 Tax=Agarilytica rhodophyticola TaxID=1737490 RepID=UPI000CD84C17|nr:SprT-like domain-containing protein [Agarilytica rhodophyticola]